MKSDFPQIRFETYTSDLMEHLDTLRINACQALEQRRRGELGQFLTPAPVAKLMASMFNFSDPIVTILDAGAGIGSLLGSAVAELCARPVKPKEIHVTAYEIDQVLIPYLHQTISLCSLSCEQAGIRFSADVKTVDFIKDIAGLFVGDLFGNNSSRTNMPTFSAAILNPPYKKINTDSEARNLLRQLGIETTNLYTGFLETAMMLLAPEAEMVAITPRSFCNGTYFRGFRENFLGAMALQRIHLFDSRQEAFRDDAVLQETIIVHSIKNALNPRELTVTSSAGAEDELVLSRRLNYGEVVHEDDPELFIRVVSDGFNQQIVQRMHRFQTSLVDLGITVSTGRVVDFRVKEHLRFEPLSEFAPLIYPVNLEDGHVAWPKQTKKSQYLRVCKETEMQFIPNENYVLVKRFSSKEQNRRVSAAVFIGGQLPGNSIGVENHLNYFHHKGSGINLSLAKGLCLYLNSTIIDAYFRQFNGHTQVNATDLRSLKYPAREEIERLGTHFKEVLPQQAEIDEIIEREFFTMSDASTSDPIATKKKLDEALEILKSLGLPKAQLNERSALTLLALLDLTPKLRWSDASQPLRGVTPMMDFMDQQYGKKYAPNSRETVRRQTIHQFLDAALILVNPDKPTRAINSGKTVYQIETSALDLLRTYGTEEWLQSLNAYLASIETLKKRYAQERTMARIPVEIAPGQEITLSPGGQNVLVEQIINEFAPRFTPGAKMIYVGDTDEKYAYFDSESLAGLGVELDPHGKMPDVIIHNVNKDWLILIEAVTSHGPINPKRRLELQKLFAGSTAGLVFVTTFLSRSAMVQYLAEISWETEVWVAESPDHMIHFNGDRFLGPYAT